MPESEDEIEDPKEQEEPTDPVEPEEPEKPEETKPSTMLDDIKLMCGIPKDNKDFDVQIKIHANGALGTLHQFGYFSGNLYRIEDNSVWDDIETDPELQASIVEYICLRTRLSFDPPQSSSLESSLTGRMDELEFRINVLADMKPREEVNE